MFVEERQKDIINKINETGRILVSEMQECYQISADCARRDLRILESKGFWGLHSRSRRCGIWKSHYEEQQDEYWAISV